MWQRLLLGFILAVSAYFISKAFSTESFVNWDNTIETPGPAPIIREPPTRGNLIVAPGGPNPPNAAPSHRAPLTRSPPAEASDPYAETAEDANAPEQLRHPERSFSPGIIPEQTAINEEANLAGPPVASSQAFQSFSPEFIQNGGKWFGNVSAQEDESPNYSAF